MRKRKKRKFKTFLILIFLLGLAFIFYYIDKNDNDYTDKEINNKLKELGYKEDSINKIKELNLIDKINVYSNNLEEALNKNIFNENCIESYINLNKDFNTIYKLCNLNYNDSEIKEITNNLDSDTINKINTYLDKLSLYSTHNNFILDNYDRYNNYEETDIKKKISYVNVNLDYEFYENIKDSINTNNNLVLVNKYYKLSEDYINIMDNISIECAVRYDIKLETKAKGAFEKLCLDAKELGYKIVGVSGYRSYNTQKIIYNNYLKSDSIKNVDTYSARAGHSEHQTGYAIDVSNNNLPYNKFGSTTEYQWAKDNIHKYGFIIRYTTDNQYITGYKNEPWHFRYVGIEAATYIYNNSITLEEYLLNNKEKI